MYHFDEKEIERQVWDFMRRFASEPVNEHSLLLDGKIHRFRVEGDKQSEKSGAYCIYSDTWPAGWIWNWRSGVQETWAFDRSALDDEAKNFFSEEKMQEVRAYWEKRKKEYRAEIEAQQKAAMFGLGIG